MRFELTGQELEPHAFNLVVSIPEDVVECAEQLAAVRIAETSSSLHYESYGSKAMTESQPRGRFAKGAVRLNLTKSPGCALSGRVPVQCAAAAVDAPLTTFRAHPFARQVFEAFVMPSALRDCGALCSDICSPVRLPRGSRSSGVGCSSRACGASTVNQSATLVDCT